MTDSVGIRASRSRLACPHLNKHQWAAGIDASTAQQIFQVVAVDEDARTVDILYFDGTVDEWPLSHWHELPIVASASPRDCRGAFEIECGDDEDVGGWDHADWLETLERERSATEPMIPRGSADREQEPS